MQLLGQYVQVGVHNVGSFGTTHTLDTAYYSSQLGIIADYDKNGFDSSPPGYSGDFVVEGVSSLEGKTMQLIAKFDQFLSNAMPFTGWIIQYVNSDNSKPTYTAEGLVGKLDVTPNTFLVSSGEAQQSAMWVAQFGSLEMRKVYQVDNDQRRIITSVAIKNTAATPITEIYCE